jgi:FKBP-type peptidyl-prolyl cis-trans isomerase FklB
MKTKIIIIASFICLSLGAVAQKKAEKKLVLKNLNDSLSYAIGSLIGADLRTGGFKDMNYDIMNIAMQKGLKGDSLSMDREVATGLLQKFAMAEMKKKAAENEKLVKEFMDKNKLVAGVVTTESGLQYKINTPGVGSKPTGEQKVKVHYTGKLLDGKVFDSSVERGEPAVFGVNQVIPGWTEALQLMPVGSKWTLYIPPALGYGEHGTQGIPGNSVLIFDVELIGIE